ncbi:phage integrase N-terminal SAM-like domain-containing protein [Aromatoleum bremense]|uniref:phage integrase N-terminal SAM-like domain-containing protein n=1 Tax=Aromatoleum bremense TaxID=76115 RepID=UPI003CC7F8FB
MRSVRVLDKLSERIRYLHYNLRTEQAYAHWVRTYIQFHDLRHPVTLGCAEVEAFLSWLVNVCKVECDHCLTRCCPSSEKSGSLNGPRRIHYLLPQTIDSSSNGCFRNPLAMAACGRYEQLCITATTCLVT